MPTKQLTEQGIAKIKPTSGKQILIFDKVKLCDAKGGLCLRVNPGSKTWLALHYVAGKGKYRKLGRYPEVGLKDAREKARRFLENPIMGTDDTRIETYEQAANAFVKSIWKTNRSWKQTAGYLGLAQDKDDPAKLKAKKGGLVKKWGHRKLDDIKKAEINAHLNALAAKSPYSANRALAAIRRFFNWAVEDSLLLESPCKGIKPKAKEKSRDRVLDDDEIRAVWNAIDAHLGWPWRPFFKILLLTGQRREEVASMQWEELDFENKIWRIPREKTKADRAHEVPLSDDVIAILKKLDRFEGPFVFSTTDGHRPISGFSRAKARLDKHLDIPGWRIHDLRRTAASGMAADGTAPHVLGRILNHAPGKTMGITSVYNRHEYATERRVALDGWARRLHNIIARKNDNVVPLTRA